MSDAIERIKGQIQGLQEELALIREVPWNRVRIADRQKAIRLLWLLLERIERSHQQFLNRRAELAARFYAFAQKSGGRQPS